jgi:hypothetical protein
VRRTPLTAVLLIALVPVAAHGARDFFSNEGNVGVTTVSFTIVQNFPVNGIVSGQYTTVDGTATVADGDYVPTSGDFFIPSGATQSAPINVLIIGDRKVEAEELFAVLLFNVQNGSAIDPGPYTIHIINDDVASLAVANSSITEGNAGTTVMSFVVTISPAAAVPVQVVYSTSNGTATAGSDYQAASGTLLFLPTQTTQVVNVTVNGDTVVEPDETLTLTVAPAGGAPATGIGTIVNDDVGTLCVANTSITEGNAGTSVMTFTVTFTPPAAIPVQAVYSTADGTATAGSDYQTAAGTLIFLPNQTTQTVNVTVNGDTTLEPNETLTLTVSLPGGPPVTGTGTIVNDDVAALSVTNASVTEGNAGTTIMTFTVTLAAAAGIPVQVTYNTANGTATAPTDYQAASGTLTFAPAQTTQVVNVTVNGDTGFEPDETFTLTVTPAGGASASGIGTIVNDDIPALSIANVSITEGNTGTAAMTFTVLMSAPVGFPVQLAYTTADGTAAAGTDYQFGSGSVTLPPNQTQQTINVIVIGDTLFEPDETLTLTVTPAGGAPVSATGTIVNDDSSPLTRVSIISGNGQRGRLGFALPQPLVVEVQDGLSKPVAGVVVQWRVTKGSAQLGSSTTTTNAQGRASNTVTLASVGAVEVEATVAQLLPATFTLGSDTLFEQRATGPIAVPIARALDQICARNESVFNGACRALSILDDGQLTPALERVAPQQSGAESKVAGVAISLVTSGIGSRHAALRSGERFSIQKLSLSISGTPVPIGALATSLVQQEPAAESEQPYNGWSGFVSGNVGTGERIGRNGQLGFDLTSSGLMAGIDRQFGDAVLGVSLNVMQLDSKLSDAAGKLDTTGYAVSVYGSWSGGLQPAGQRPEGRRSTFDGLHVDGSLTIGRNRYDAEHVVDIPTLPLSIARSKNDASVFALTAGTGLEAHQGRTDYDLSLSGTWSRADIDDLTENGDGPLILFVQGHEIESAVATAGLNVRTAIPTSFGNVLPMFRAEMIHEFKSGARLVTARFLRDSLNTAFTIPIDQPDPNYGRLSAGIQAVFPRGVSAFIEATQDVLRSDLHFRTIQVNVSKSF